MDASPNPWVVSVRGVSQHYGKAVALDDVSLLQADVTKNDAIDVELMSSLGIYGPPAILFFDAEGREIPGRRVVGFMPGEEFAAHVNATFR